MAPSISPSTVRSSRLKICPLMVTDFPMLAPFPANSSSAVALTGTVDNGDPSFMGSGETGGVYAALGVYSSSFRLLFHIDKNSHLVYIDKTSHLVYKDGGKAQTGRLPEKGRQ